MRSGATVGPDNRSIENADESEWLGARSTCASSPVGCETHGSSSSFPPWHGRDAKWQKHHL